MTKTMAMRNMVAMAMTLAALLWSAVPSAAAPMAPAVRMTGRTTLLSKSSDEHIPTLMDLNTPIVETTRGAIAGHTGWQISPNGVKRVFVMGAVGAVVNNLFSIENEKGEQVGQLLVSLEYGGAYAVNAADGAMPVPADGGRVKIRMALIVADQAASPSGQNWGVELQILDGTARRTIELDPGGTSGTIDLEIPGDGRGGLIPIPSWYRFRAGREYTGVVRALGKKILTLGAKAGMGTGASGIWLHVVQTPPEMDYRNPFVLIAWAQSMGAPIYPLVSTWQPASVPSEVTRLSTETARLQDATKAVEALNANDAKIASVVETLSQQVVAVAGGLEQFKSEVAGYLSGGVGQVSQQIIDTLNAVSTAIEDLKSRLARIEGWPGFTAGTTSTSLPWTAVPVDGKLVVTAMTDGVTISVDYGPGIDARHSSGSVVRAITLKQGEWLRVTLTASVRVEVSDTAGRRALYGPNGQIGR